MISNLGTTEKCLLLPILIHSFSQSTMPQFNHVSAFIVDTDYCIGEPLGLDSLLGYWQKWGCEVEAEGNVG